MGTIAFMPWIQFQDDFRVGDYDFIKINPRSNPAANLPAPYDQILNCTLLHNQSNPTQFTAIKHKDHSFIWGTSIKDNDKHKKY